MADKLSADGFNVVSRELLPVACSLEQLTALLDDEGNRKLFEEIDVIIPLSCQRGIESAKDILPGLSILRVTETLGTGSFSPEAGARLTAPDEGLDIEMENPEGISLPEVAHILGMHAGSF
ncbi:MAG: hypothetical protein QGH29_04760 [Kiritimatiellia bacterium]|nr:hypothetical protein [Kiritimatiellia bacterium]